MTIFTIVTMMVTSFSTILATDSDPDSESKSATITYDVPSSYEWTIHEAITLTKDNPSVDAYVTVTKANLADGKAVEIKMKGSGTEGAFVMTSGKNTLNYTVTYGNKSVTPNESLFVVTSSEKAPVKSNAINFALKSTEDIPGGKYTGTVTYTATLIDVDKN